jgi:hypothetical protein
LLIGLALLGAHIAAEHLQHAVGDEESADDVRCRAHDRDESEDRGDAIVRRARAISEPTSEMPEIAFVAAINGVCSSAGTREITM